MRTLLRPKQTELRGKHPREGDLGAMRHNP